MNFKRIPKLSTSYLSQTSQTSSKHFYFSLFSFRRTFSLEFGNNFFHVWDPRIIIPFSKVPHKAAKNSKTRLSFLFFLLTWKFFLLASKEFILFYSNLSCWKFDSRRFMAHCIKTNKHIVQHGWNTDGQFLEFNFVRKV